MPRYVFSFLGYVILALSLASCTTNKGSFSLVNKSNETISYVIVKICNQVFEWSDIESNKSVSGSYNIKSDDHYVIEVRLSSGNKFIKEVGYVTHGLDFQHEIIITKSDVEIINNNP